jgi:hypothetical protein
MGVVIIIIIMEENSRQPAVLFLPITSFWLMTHKNISNGATTLSSYLTIKWVQLCHITFKQSTHFYS